MVHRFKNSYYDKEDLFQIGCIGLMKAINHFDHIISVFNFQHMQYLLLWEKSNAILEMMEQSKFLVHLKELNIKVTKAKEILADSQNNQEPTIEEVAKLFGV
ncbi:MAG: sigma factor [Coprobacillus cateniformis]